MLISRLAPRTHAASAVTLAAVTSLAVGLTVGLVPGRAQADTSRAWAAAKDSLPGNTTMVVGIDFGAITKSTLFGMLMPIALAQKPDIKKGLELVKSTCKIDPFAALQGVVFSRDPDTEKGAIFFQLGGGLDQAKLTKCVEDVAKASGVKDAKLTVTKTGAITELSTDKSKDKLYVSWIGADVLAIALDVRDRGQLEKWIGGKGAFGKSAVAKLVASANTKGVVWGASSQTKQLDPGITAKGAHGALTMAGGSLAVELHVMLDSAKAATDAVAKANDQLSKVSAGKLPPNVAAMIKQVSVKAAGPEVTVKASVPENEVLGLLALLKP